MPSGPQDQNRTSLTRPVRYGRYWSMGKTRTAAVGYLRVSGLSQADKGGFERQRRTVEDFARREGYEIQRLYEETHSGTDEDRALFGQMVADLVNNCCSVVVVESMDRFARDMAVQCALLAKLEENGIVLLNATTGENVADAMASDPMRRALIQIQGVLAELDKNNAVARMRPFPKTRSLSPSPSTSPIAMVRVGSLSGGMSTAVASVKVPVPSLR